MTAGTLEHFRITFASVGWFIPPYVMMGFLSTMATEIERKGNCYSQDDLQGRLSHIYGPEALSAMVCSRYPITPVLAGYKETIAESIEAHFLGLHHVAVAGLVPVIEGAGRELLAARNLKASGVCGVFDALAMDCKREVIERSLGATGELVSMLDSFADFTKNVLYIDSRAYPFVYGTNRHGISHGAFRDDDYGKPINFYKTIGAVDFLMFVSAFRASISCFAPSSTSASENLANYYRHLTTLRSTQINGVESSKIVE